ncbi:MAG: hypothetical protein IKP00_01120 [Victivallales bacterium]|nr:hypothetical protein [Victivallales bacterium]
MRRITLSVLSGLLFALLFGGQLPITPMAQEHLIDGQRSQTVEFTLPEDLKTGEYLNLEFDGYLKFKRYSGYDCCLSVECNGELIAGEALLNVPEMFLRSNGMDSISYHWRNNRFYLLYAPSLEAARSEKNEYRPLHWNGTTYRFDISKYAKPGKNTLTFINGQPTEVHKLFNDDTPIPAVISNINLFTSAEKTIPAEEWWITELKELNETPRYVEPRKNTAEDFTYQLLENGQIVIRSGSAVYRLDTFFSYPHGGYNSFGSRHLEQPEQEFRVVTSVNGRGATVNGGGKYYTVERSIMRQGNYISVKDILTNLTETPLGVIVRSQLTTDKRNDKPIMVSGLPVATRTEIHSPENASVFLPSGEGGCALVPNDDILQFQALTYVVDDNNCGLNNPSLVLQGKKQVTLEFEIYPVAKGDMFTFVNNARDNWGLNGIEATKGKRALIWEKESLPRLMERWKPYEEAIGSIYVCHFAGWTKTTPRRTICKWGWAVLQDSDMLNHRKELFEVLRRDYPLARKVPLYYCIMAPYGSNHPDNLDDKLFGEWLVINKSGVKLTEAGYRFFILTQDNGPGKALRQLVDTAIDDWKCDGLFFDYLEGAKAYYTYNRADGVSGDIHPTTKLLSCEKASYQLLSQEFIINLMRYIINERKVPVVGNRSFYTRTTREALKELIPMRFGEAGCLFHVARNYFAPVPNSLQRTYRNTPKQFLSALYLGVVPQEYDYPYTWTDCPDTAAFPIAIDELGRGYILGTDKIITAISGDFSFGSDDPVRVSLFNYEGHRIPADFKQILLNGKRVTQVRIQFGEIAFIDRVK